MNPKLFSIKYQNINWYEKTKLLGPIISKVLYFIQDLNIS